MSFFDQVEGNKDELAGKAEHAQGDVADDARSQAEGLAGR